MKKYNNITKEFEDVIEDQEFKKMIRQLNDDKIPYSIKNNEVYINDKDLEKANQSKNKMR